MQWIFSYQLFLFDFDGLLVDTEPLHYQAYLEMCARRGYHLNWDFARFSQAAYRTPPALREEIYTAIPALHAEEPDWQILYEEKQRCLMALLDHHPIQLMAGVTPLLHALQTAKIPHCVVTHSPASFVRNIRKRHLLLDTIPHWITREDYVHPKPNPTCYQMAIDQLAHPTDEIIGFEDSPRGLDALLGTRAKPVLICPSDASHLAQTLTQHPYVLHYPSFVSLVGDLNDRPDI